jgi:hypothetical protein
MALRRYRMYASVTATGAVQDSMVFQRPCRIKQVEWAVAVNSITDNGSAFIQLSRASVYEGGTSAAGSQITAQTISQYAAYANFVTSGLATNQGNQVVPCNDSMSAGEKLYINAAVGGTIQCLTEILITVEE